MNRSWLAEQLLTVAGTSREMLRDAPKERTKQVAMGAVLVSTAGIAAVSATYATYLALHFALPFAILGGLAWGLVILNLDRWLVVSTPRLKTKIGTLAMALPRVLLAILIGAVISTPLTLAVFGAEIDAEIRVMAAEAEDEFNTKLESDSRYQELPELRERVQVLQADVAQPATDADVLADPAVVALQARMDDVTARHNAAADAFLCETDGSCGTGDPGIAVAALEKKAERDRLAVEREGLLSELGALKQQVRQQLDAEEVQKTADQTTELAALEDDVADTRRAMDAEIANHEEEVGDSDGILSRLTALERIQDGSSMLATAHLLLFLFMTALECLPIIFKTMLALAPPSLYERLVALDEEKAEARVRLRMQTDYEEAETMARSALASAEARAARTLEAESRATGMVLQAQLAVTREGLRRWRDEQLGRGAEAAGRERSAPDSSPDELDAMWRFEDNVVMSPGPDNR
jgi:hypothetical protein